MKYDDSKQTNPLNKYYIYYDYLYHYNVIMARQTVIAKDDIFDTN